MLNPFSIVLLLLLLLCFFRTVSIKQIFFRLFILTTAIQLFVEVGFFVKIGDADVNYRTVCELIVLLFSLPLLIKKGRFKISIYSNYCIKFLALSIIGLTILLIVPSSVQVASIDTSWDDILVKGAELGRPMISGFVIQQTFQFFIAILAILVCYETFDRADFVKMIGIFSLIVKIFLVIGLIEFCIKYLFSFINYGTFVKFVFGYSDSTILEARNRGFGIELQGLTKEASHYAYVLFLSIVILIANNVVLKSTNKKWILLAIMLMVFSMSFSTVLFGSALYFINLLYRWNQLEEVNRRRKQVLTGIVFVLVLLIMISQISSLSTDGFFSRRFLSLIEEFGVISNNTWQTQHDALEWSNRVRLLSVFMSIKAFLSRPIFGFGLGTVTSHGSTIMMLCGVGILGLYMWIKVFFSMMRNRFWEVNLKYWRASIFIFLFVNLLNSLGLRPFYEFHTFLLVISFMILYKKTVKCEFQ